MRLTSHYASYNLNSRLFSQAPDIDSDLFVEVLGILVNLDIPSYDWPAFIAKHDLLTLLSGKHPPPPLFFPPWPPSSVGQAGITYSTCTPLQSGYTV